MTKLAAPLLLGSMLAAPVALAGDTPAPADAYLYIGWPNDGEVINACRFRVWFGLRHMGVAPAGVEKANTGHHHLMADTDLPPADQPIPNDRNHLHFGAGQTEGVEVDLVDPGVDQGPHRAQRWVGTEAEGHRGGVDLGRVGDLVEGVLRGRPRPSQNGATPVPGNRR